MLQLVILSGGVLGALLGADWWASQRDWDLRQRLAELATAAHHWNEPLSLRRSRWTERTAQRQRRREKALASLAVASRASHDVQLHRHFTIGPPQVVLTYAGHRVKIRLYNETVWRLNSPYRVKLVALEPDDAVGWRFTVYSPDTGRVAQLAWLVTTA